MSLKRSLGNLKSQLSTRLNFPYLYRKPSYSQEGEDMILKKIFAEKDKGFYIDVGAFHPFLYSNTQLLYEKGWKGINIEPTPGRINLFKRVRKRDINLEYAIGNRKRTLDFQMFTKPALNTFDKKRAQVISNSKQSQLKKTVRIQTRRLDDILNHHLSEHQHIDLLNIDVEGFELQVLKSNDWKKFKPDIILVENFHYLPSLSYLKKYEYEPFAQTYSTQFFKQIDLKL